MALEGRSLRHYGSDHESFDVFWLHPRDRIEARLARFPDQVAVRRLAHAELRHARADEGDLPHDRLPRAAASSPSASAACPADRKSTRLNSSHLVISYAVFCLKKKKKQNVKREVNSQNRLERSTCVEC